VLTKLGLQTQTIRRFKKLKISEEKNHIYIRMYNIVWGYWISVALHGVNETGVSSVLTLEGGGLSTEWK